VLTFLIIMEKLNPPGTSSIKSAIVSSDSNKADAEGRGGGLGGTGGSRGQHRRVMTTTAPAAGTRDTEEDRLWDRAAAQTAARTGTATGNSKGGSSAS